ncbi:MAG: hypothetical protein ACRD2Z_18890 [Thermoanaerobaculia bacterium]
MIAIWILLALAVLFGGAILALTVYAVRHDDRAREARPGAAEGER